MANFCLKKPSKRMTCRKKYKIARKIREHNRKKRKESKRLMNKPMRKLIHVPNICPFKEEILKNVSEFKKEKAMELKENRKLLRLQKNEEISSNSDDIEYDSILRKIGITSPDEVLNDFVIKKEEGGKSKTYYREFQKVIAAADVILEVADARDPLGTRCPAVEKSVRQAGQGKRLVLVLNKADLVPREILDQWITFLRRTVPAIPFKSSTQTQKNRLGRRKLRKKQNVSTNSVCIGAEGLTSLLANYTRNKGIKTSIRVGVVGLPNVGKSSLINSLKRSRSCKVGATPGITRSLQEVQLDSKIKLLDSPGLAFAKNTDPNAALKNSVLTTDPLEPAEMIISRANKQQLKSLYLVDDFNTHTEFLVSLAKRCGRIKRGGIADINAAAKILVNDWNRGKISYYVQPPEMDSSHEVSSSIVSSDVAEFDLDSYDKKVFCERQMEIDRVQAPEIKSNRLVVCAKKSKRKNVKAEVVRKKEESLQELEGNLRLKKVQKLKMKKARKQKARTERAADKLADTMAGISL